MIFQKVADILIPRFLCLFRHDSHRQGGALDHKFPMEEDLVHRRRHTGPGVQGDQSFRGLFGQFIEVFDIHAERAVQDLEDETHVSDESDINASDAGECISVAEESSGCVPSCCCA